MCKYFTAILFLALTGCASTTGFLNREIQENEISVADKSYKDGHVVASVLGMSENRRGILIRDNRRLPDGTPSIFFCAEPPPDVAMSTRAGAAAAIDLAKKGSAEVSDQYARIAMLIANRTSLLDIYRTAVFSLCQLHMNGVLTHQKSEDMFREITLKVIEKAPATETPRSATNDLNFGDAPKVKEGTENKDAATDTKKDEKKESS